MQKFVETEDKTEITEEEEQEEEQDLRRQKLFQRKKWISLKKKHQMKTESEESDSERITPEKK